MSRGPGAAGIRLKIALVAALVCAVSGVGSWIVWTRSHRPVTARDVLNEARMEWQCAGERPQLINEIFEQQAALGYYDDAASTGLLSRRPDEIQHYIVELARIRTENGDLAGAQAMMKRFADPSLSPQIAEAIVFAQVTKGDLPGALESAAKMGVTRENVLMQYARRQMANGNFENALETAALMKAPDELFGEVGVNLVMQSAQKRLPELVRGMKDRKLAAKFEKTARIAIQSPQFAEFKRLTPCEIAAYSADHGEFAKANALIERNKCKDNSFVAIKEYELNPVTAEHLLRETSSGDDLMFGLGQLAVAAAKNGNPSEALRFLIDLERTASGGLLAQIRVCDAVHGIGHYWTAKDGAKIVLKWARSRPTCEQRASALLGVAEALGHANLAKR